MPLGINTIFSGLERLGGSPAEVYTFQRGSDVWRYTSARSAQTVNSLTYQPASVKRGDVEQKNDIGGSQITVTLALETAVAQALTTETGERMAVTIQRLQSSGDPIKLVIAGEVIAAKFSGDAVELTVATIERLFKTLIPRVRVQRTCPWALFGPQCGLNKDDFAHSTTISSVSGQVITVGSVGAITMKGGMIRLPSGRIMFVAAVSSTDLTVWGEVPAEAAATASVTLYPGCNKLFSTCENTFNNAAHFGGFPNLPHRNVTTTTMN